MSRTIRTQMLLGEAAVNRLSKAHIAVFGVGGVGGYAAEAIARCGVGSIDLFDSDTVNESNINRQIIATVDTIGQKKVEVMKKRIAKINPDAKVTAYDIFYTAENSNMYPLDGYTYVIDAIDTVSSKIQLICECKRLGVPIISAMGAGNKLHPEMLEVSDIYKTSVCPLARVLRRELKQRGIRELKVVYSKEKPITPLPLEKPAEGRRQTPGSIAFVPSVSGLIMAGEVINDICGT